MKLSFDLIDGDSPLIIGLYVNKFANLTKTQYAVLIRPSDNKPRKLQTYIAKDAEENERMRIETAQYIGSSPISLMANKTKRPEPNFKKVHRFTHVHTREMKWLFQEAGMLTTIIRKAVDKGQKSCSTCTSSVHQAVLLSARTYH